MQSTTQQPGKDERFVALAVLMKVYGNSHLSNIVFFTSVIPLTTATKLVEYIRRGIGTMVTDYAFNSL